MRGLVLFITIVGPYLRTPKIDHLNGVIALLNANSTYVLKELKLDKSPMLSNSWLAGFIDADGSFDIQITESKDGNGKNRVSVRFRLEQRMTD